MYLKNVNNLQPNTGSEKHAASVSWHNVEHQLEVGAVYRVYVE